MIKLDLNHPTIQMAKSIHNASQSFLQTHNLNYFQYLRCYKDGRMAVMINDTSLFNRFLHLDTPVVFSAFSAQHAKKHTYWFLWDEELQHAPLKLARDEHGWHHGLTLLKRYHDYYDMIAVAMPCELSNASTYYINRLPAIEQFMINFANHAPDLFNSATKHAIALPEVNRDIHYQQLCLTKENRFPFGKTYATGQELQCLAMRLNGYAYKEIAKICQISPRTVETYLQRLKARSGVSDKMQLQELINSCQ